MLLEYNPNDYEVETGGSTCYYHKHHPGDNYAGCTCSAWYRLTKKQTTPKVKVSNKIYAAHVEDGKIIYKPTDVPDNQCGFNMSWAGLCKGKATPHTFCEKHGGKVCVSCKKIAVKDCGFASQFVCGAPLCETGTECSGHGGHGCSG